MATHKAVKTLVQDWECKINGNVTADNVRINSYTIDRPYGLRIALHFCVNNTMMFMTCARYRGEGDYFLIQKVLDNFRAFLIDLDYVQDDLNLKLDVSD